MPKKTAATSIFVNTRQQLQKAWAHLTKKQKVTLGVLSFLVFVLPLSLLIIKTQTNILPKAAYPITPPFSTPSPRPSPPSGCFYQPVQCFQAPCDPIVVCPSPSPTPLAGYCEQCNDTVSPNTPYSRCADGLVCHREANETCHTLENGQTVCTAVVGAPGTCVRPGEDVGVCGASPSPTPSPVPAADFCQTCNTSNFPGTTYVGCVDGLVCQQPQAGCITDENGYQLCYDPYPGIDGKCVRPGESIDVCQNQDPISLAGDTLPNDPRITFHKLEVNYPLLAEKQNTLIFQEDYTNTNSAVLPIEDGYGQFYIINPSAGKKLEALVRELNSSSYIKTVLYGPDKKKITEAGTRIQFTTENNGPYYLVAHTFDQRQGSVEITVSDEYRKYLFPYVKRIDRDMELLWDNYTQTNYRLGRKPADFFLQVPWLKNINDNIYIVYEHQTDRNILQMETPRAKITQTCPITQESREMLIKVERMGHDELNPLRTMQVKISPQSFAYFPPGYNYVVNLEYPDPNVGWRASFSTTSQSGLAANLNDDDIVDISDYSLLISELMQDKDYPIADLNCDGMVDISDYSLLINNISL